MYQDLIDQGHAMRWGGLGMIALCVWSVLHLAYGYTCVSCVCCVVWWRRLWLFAYTETLRLGEREFLIAHLLGLR